MKKENREVVDMLVLILQIGITMLVPIMLCLLGGAWLDTYFKTKWIAVVGFALGVAAGFKNVYRLVKRYLK